MHHDHFADPDCMIYPDSPRRTPTFGVSVEASNDASLASAVAARNQSPRGGRAVGRDCAMVEVHTEYSLEKKSHSGVGNSTCLPEGKEENYNVSDLSSPESKGGYENRGRFVSKYFPVVFGCCLSDHTGRGDAPRPFW